MAGDIQLEKHGAVWLVTINQPRNVNSLDFAAHDIAVWNEFAAK